MRRLLPLIFAFAVVTAHAADLSEAVRLMDAKRVPEALPLIESALAANKNDADALTLLGSCQFQMLEFEAAIESLQRATIIAPTNGQAHTLLGMALLNEAGRKSSLSYARRGRAALDRARELRPDDILTLDASISFYSSAPWIAGGDNDKALELVGHLRKIDPAKAFSVEVGLLAKAKKYDDAFKLCDARLKQLPDDYMALYEFGRICGMASRRQEEGVIALQKCLAQTPPPVAPGHEGANFRLGVLHKQLAHAELSKQCFDEALRLAGNNPDLIKRIEKAR